MIPDPESVRKQIPEGVTDVEFVVDPQILAVSDLFECSAAQTPHRARWFLHLTEEIKATWQATSGDIPQSTDGAAIQRYIAAAHNVIAERAAQVAASISKRRWLHYSRRLPFRAFPAPAHLQSSGGGDSPYETSLFDAFTALYGRDSESEAESRPFVADVSDSRALIYVRDAVLLLGELQQAYRFAGRGALYTISPEDGLPNRMSDPEFDERIARFHGRLARAQSNVTAIPQLGTMASEYVRDKDLNDQLSILVVRRLHERTWNVFPDLWAEDPTKAVAIYTGYLPPLLSLGSLGSLFLRSPELTAALDSSVATTIAFLAAAVSLGAGPKLNFAALAMFGFLEISNGDIEGAIEAGFADSTRLLAELNIPAAKIDSPESLIREAEHVPARIWPIRRGAFVRRGAAATLLDVYGATCYLDVILQCAGAGGETANVRAVHFEDALQRLIDRSTWKPTDKLRAIRQRSLRQGRVTLTDVDAIGACDETLLLVSCKSRLFDEGYELGEYAPTRNAQSLAADAHARWQQFVSRLRQNPKGDNFDFSEYSAIIGVVCFPMPLFLDLSLVNAEAAQGLPAIACFAELEQWLSSNS